MLTTTIHALVTLPSPRKLSIRSRMLKLQALLLLEASAGNGYALIEVELGDGDKLHC